MDFNGRPMIFILLVLLSLGLPSTVGAAEFGLDTTLLGQVRENEGDQTEIPVNGYLGLGFSQSKWNFSGETNMRLFRDFPRKLDDYDLYQAVLHIQPIQALKIDFGRQFVSEGFSTEILDGIRLTLMPLKYLDITVYTGMPRSVETGDFDKNNGLFSGISLGLKNVARTNARIHAAWRKHNIRFNDLKQNDEILVGADLSHQFAIPERPLLYGLVEYNVTGKNLDAGTAGVDIAPFSGAALNLEFNYFNVNRDSDRPTILGLFARGRLLTGRFASTWTLIPDRLDFVESYSYQRIEIQEDVRRHGHLLDTAFRISWDEIGLHVEPGYYFARSFGGNLHGVRASLHEQFTDRWYAEAGVDFSKYTKITGKNDTAFSTVIWTGYEVVKDLTLSGGFEYNRNTLFDKDIRGSFKVEYRFNYGT